MSARGAVWALGFGHPLFMWNLPGRGPLRPAIPAPNFSSVGGWRMSAQDFPTTRLFSAQRWTERRRKPASEGVSENEAKRNMVILAGDKILRRCVFYDSRHTESHIIVDECNHVTKWLRTSVVVCCTRKLTSRLEINFLPSTNANISVPFAATITIMSLVYFLH